MCIVEINNASGKFLFYFMCVCVCEGGREGERER